MTVVKICGIRDPETAVEAVKAGADLIGIMFAESKRRVTPQECHDVIEALRSARGAAVPGFDAPARGEVRGLSWYGAWSEAIEESSWRSRPLIVGVFAGQSVSEVNDIADAAGLDLVQLSGGESREFIDQIERPVLSAIHVSPEATPEDLVEIALDRRAAGLLLDTASSVARGGTGQSFDWRVATAVQERLPFLLAGGLTPLNVAEAVAAVEPWGVDVSSGVETDGKKDIEKIRAFIRAAKGMARVH